MELLAGLAVAFGLLLIFDSLTRPLNAAARLPRLLALPQLAGAMTGGAAAYALTGWPVLLAGGALIGAFLPGVLTQQRSLAKRIALTDALAEAAAGLRDAVRGGLGLSDGLAGLAVWGPPVLRDDISMFAADAGRSGLSAAAARFARRLGACRQARPCTP